MGGVKCLTASKRRWVMLCILLGLGLSSLGSAIVNIALPNISRSFASSDAAAVWVVNAYQLSATICLLPVASLAESLGLKRVYAAGLAIFILASVGCAFAPTLPILVSARLIQGAGAAGVAVAGVAFVRVVYPHRMVSKGLALVALAVAIPGALGPTIAAAILAVAKWPWLFLVNVPFGLAVPLFIAAAPPDLRVARSLDLTGTALNALAFGLFVVGVGTLGTGDGPIATGEIVAGLFCLGLFVRQQLQHPMPMLPFDLFRIPLFTLSVWTSVCSYAAQILAYVSLPFLFETSMHLSAVETGFLVTPWPLMTAVTAPIAGRLTIRHPASVICSVGLTLLAVGLLLMVFLPTAPAKWDVAWRLALCGIGFGLFQTPNNTAMMTAGPVGRSGAASGMNAAARYIGWSLGSALVSLIFGLGGDRGAISCMVAAMAFALMGAATSSARRFR
ncbi:DHA2 family multidrug resistance protein-like MFS transporter [Bradyrhizobium sp. R2.2-H]|jgi:DHA2 family multidrug resistance protein-like MFS transporter|nr:DHA2 family multidrug resistance protein-like MFS transporter [Bradyrhizobium sp. Y-H1]TCU65894.1 DHA2 family multidrug resistance protein-like MFS transporter [Bradyrhizobium sp. R2.2-H]